jgi:hypothetical protein
MTVSSTLRRVRVFPIALALVAMVPVALGTTPAHAAPSCTWTLPPTKAPTYLAGMRAVDAASTKDAWGVGAVDTAPGTAGTGIAYHWSRGRWNEVPTPSVVGDIFYSVADISPTDAWIVGEEAYAGQPYHPLAEHWDGASWQKVTILAPIVGSTGEELDTYFTHVSASGPDDVCVTGTVYDSHGDDRLLEHWDGASWSSVALPELVPGGQSDFLSGLKVVSANDVYVSENANGHGHVWHFDGTTWQEVYATNPLASEALGAVAASASDNVWVMGNGLIERWDGLSWQRLETRPLFFNSLTTFSMTDAWAVGIGTYHFDGSSWTQESVVDPTLHNPRIYGVAAIPGTHQLWAFGLKGGNKKSKALFMLGSCA